ncbi:Rad52/Rad22 family DNA repair protein [Fusobacterium sp.]|uniref:Rad52/Rad22 family DNA repair protein n=1 Tax=Fusobacterium sp. TaxID=68766 RepID=UPI0025C6F9CE|nr:Rad52/Rad22 family DNA repair protein [Fusobacterium sp.]
MDKLLEKLREPFAREELEFRVGAISREKMEGLALAYVQARAIQNRLDEIFGIDGWTVTYKEVSAGFICSLSIKINDRWITKEDGASMTEYESIKGGISNAFKRVASSGFGIGRYLYKAKNKWYPIRQQGKGYTFIVEPELELEDNTLTFKKSKKEEESKVVGSSKIVIEFGKYKGLTLQEIYDKDINYIKYLKANAKDKKILQGCVELIA